MCLSYHGAYVTLSTNHLKMTKIFTLVLFVCCTVLCSCESIGQKKIKAYHKNFAQQLLDKSILTKHQHHLLLENIQTGKTNAVLDFLPYCKHAKIIDLVKAKSETDNETDYIAAILDQIASIHPDINYSNLEGSFIIRGPYVDEGGIRISHKNLVYYDFPETEDKLPLILNKVLRAEQSEYQILTVYNEINPDEATDTLRDYKTFGVIALRREELDDLVYYSPETKLFFGASYPSYITKEHLQKGLDFYQQIGLFDELTPAEIKAGTDKVLEQSFTNFNAVLNCFPSLIFHEAAAPSQTNGKTYPLYTKTEGQRAEQPSTFIRLTRKQYQSLKEKNYLYFSFESGLDAASIANFENKMRAQWKLFYSNEKEQKVKPPTLDTKLYCSSLKEALKNPENVKLLNLSNIGLTTFPMDILKLSNLEVLNLGGNELTSLPPEIRGLKKLRELNLIKNNFDTLPSVIGELANMERLELGYNGLLSLPPEIGKLEKLEILHLNFNKLETLPSEIGQLKVLRYINLSGNRVTHFPKELWQVITLEQLILDRNKLTELPAGIGQLAILNQLTLDKNKLEALPSEFGNLSSLNYLSVSKNSLKGFPPEMKGLTRLSYFFYRNNPLDKVEKESMDAWLLKQEQRLFWGKHLVK